MSDEEKGFKVADRRKFRDVPADEPSAPVTPEVSEPVAPPPGERAEEAAPAFPAGDPGELEQEGEAAEYPPAEFLSFVFELATQVYLLLGEIPHPVTQERITDLPMAKHYLDTLGMLEEKTRGNLTPDEERKLGTILAELRMRFVQKAQP